MLPIQAQQGSYLVEFFALEVSLVDHDKILRQILSTGLAEYL